MILVTGGAGFIGSCFVKRINELNLGDVVIVDDVGCEQKWKNLRGLDYEALYGINRRKEVLAKYRNQLTSVIHLGACSTTTEKNVDYLLENNTLQSMEYAEFCLHSHIPFIYASSAATYGMGEHGFEDDHSLSTKLMPINPYGYSKHQFDCWMIKNHSSPDFFWAGLKFFNVYGPNEYHKGSQASVVFHAFQQIKESGKVRLFKSHKNGVPDGEQKRDFVHVMDAVDIGLHLLSLQHYPNRSGIFNVGTGKARSFLDLVRAVFKSMQKEVEIDWVDTPVDLRSQYQYFTESKNDKIKSVLGDKVKYQSLEEGVATYVRDHLTCEDPFLRRVK